MASPLVGIVILNWNRLELTQKCLKSVAKQTYDNYQVYLIDNGSRDGSVEWLQAQTELNTVYNPKNVGFARAINQGISTALESDCQYVVALNNDAEISADWLSKLVSYMEKHPKAGFAQGASMQADSKKLFDSSGIYLERGFIPNQRALGSSEPKLDMPIIGPNAAGAIYRADMLRAVRHSSKEYFDGRFFAYVEDVDFNLRCTMRGYECGYVPDAKLFHIGSATGNTIAKKKMFWGSRNMVWLVYKNVPLRVLKRTIKSIIKSHLANLQFLWREQRANFYPYLYGLLVGLIAIPWFMRRRWINLHARTVSNEVLFEMLIPSNPPLSNPFRKLRDLLK